MSKPTEADAKVLTTGLKETLRQFPYLLREVTVSVDITAETGDTLSIRMTGVPPFTVTEVSINEQFIERYYGSPEVQ